MAKHERRTHGAGGARRQPEREQPRQRDAQTAGLSQDQEAAVETLLANLPATAAALRAAGPEGRDAVAAQLAPVDAAEEPVQQAFAARLGEARGPRATDAAEVANALGELSARREVAREARRARIRLRSAGALPTLDLARSAGRMTAAPEAEAAATPAPLLVEAHVTRTREQGEVSMVLAWQEGNDPNIVRGCVMTLDFWRQGVKHFELSEPITRRRFIEDILGDLRSELDAETATVTWAQARLLLLEALDVNAWRGTEPDATYLRHQNLMRTRLLDLPDSDEARAAVAEEEARAEREGDRAYLATDLDPDETVANWLGTWCFGDYGAAYDLLANDHPSHQEQTRDAYIAQRRQWADEARPGSLRLTLVRDQAQRASALWVPGAAGVVAPGGRRDVEAFWSVTVNASPLGGALPELPLATLTSKETGRHWYWTAYTLERDRATSVWRIARNRDEGAASQSLTIEELQKRIQEAHAAVEKMTAAPPPEPGSEAADEALREITGALTSALHYSDALSVRLPLDESIHRGAITDAQSLGNYERAAALLERMQGRFGDPVRTTFELGIQYYMIVIQLSQQGDVGAAHTWLERAVSTFRQAAEAQPSGEHLQALGEALARQGHYSQAVASLREAVALNPGRGSIHADLADVLMSEASGENLDAPAGQSAPDEATRLQRVREAGRAALIELREALRLDRSLPSLYSRMGAIYEVLDQQEDAVLAFQEAVRHEPNDPQAHFTLGTFYLSRREPERALTELEEAAHLAPSSLPIRVNLAACYVALERWRDAERELDFVDEVRPGLPQIAELRTQIARLKKR